MASEYDGHVKIAVELDSKPLEKDVSKAKDNLEKEVSKPVKVKVEAEADTSGVKKEVENIKKEVESVQKTSVTINTGMDTKSVDESLKTLQNVQTALNDIYGKSVQNANDFDGKLGKINQQLLKQVTTANNLDVSLQNILRGETEPKSIQNLEKDLKSLRKEAESTGNQIDSYENKLQSFVQEHTEISVQNGKTVERMGELTKAEQAQFDSLNALVEAGIQKYSELELKISGIKSRISELKANPQLTDEFQQLSASLKNSEAEIVRLKNEMEGLGAAAADYRIGESGHLTESEAQAVNDLTEKNKELTQSTQEVASKMQQKNSTLKSQTAATQKDSAASKVLTSVLNGLKGAVMAVLAGLTSLGKSGASSLNKVKNGIISGIKKPLTSALSTLSVFGKKSPNIIDTFVKRTKRLILTVFIWRQLRKAITAVFNGFKEGISNYIKWDSALSKSTARLKDTASQLKNALGSALAPIVQTFIPYLQQLADWLVTVADKFAQFTAALSGKSTYAKAKAITTATEALEDNAQAADDAKKSLASFDELEVQTSSETSKGTDTTGVADMFEETPIDSDLLDYVDSLRDKINGLLDALKTMRDELKKAIEDVIKLFISGDWDNLLTPLTQLFTKWLKNINWSSIKKQAQVLGKRLAQILNSIFKDLDFAYTLGKTLAEGINTALEFAYAFLTTFDFYQFGAWLGTGLNGVIENLDWALLGKVLGASLNGIVDIALGFLDTTHWDLLGQGIATTINNFFKEINWYNVGLLIATGLNSLGTVVLNLLVYTDWGNIGKSLMTALLSAITNFDGATWGAIIAESINSLAEFIIGFFVPSSFRELGEQIRTTIQDLIDTAIADINTDEIGQALYNLVGSAVEFALGLLGADDDFVLFPDGYSIFPDDEESFTTKLSKYFNIDDYSTQLSLTLNNLVSIFSGAFDSIGKVVKDSWDNIIEPVLKTLATTGLPLVLKFCTSASESLAVLGKDAKTVFDSLWSDAVEPNLELIVKMFDDMATSINNNWDDTIQPVFDLFNDAVGDLGDKFDSFWNTTVKPILDNLNTNLNDLWDNHLKDLFDKVLYFIGKIADDTQLLWDKTLSPIVDWLINEFSAPIKNIINIIVDSATTGIETIIGVISGIIDVLSGIIDFVTGVFTGDLDKAMEGLHEMLAGYVKIIASLFEGLINGIIDMINGMISLVVDGVNNYLDKWNATFEYFGSDKKINTFDKFKISHVSLGNIPGLAQGTVIPPSMNEFIARLGDNNTDTEIVSPLETMKQAFMEALSEAGMTGGADVNVYLQGDADGIFKVVRTENSKWKKQHNGVGAF